MATATYLDSPAADVGELDLEALDTQVEAAIRRGSPAGLHVLGYGEITLVLGWPPERPVMAVKRLPAFPDEGQAESYAAVLSRYLQELERRGVTVVPTELSVVTGREVHGYLLQPLVERATLLNHVLAASDRRRGGELLAALADRVAGAVDERLGLDAQAANWAVDGDRLACLDISTPLLRSADGRDELDLSVFLSVYPWALRAALRRVAHGVMGQYHDPRAVLVDVASNLLKERLGHWLEPLLDAANTRVNPPIEEAEVRHYFARDKQLWLLMQRLRRADRAWQRRVRHRPYPFLLPPPYAYGPPELPEESR